MIVCPNKKIRRNMAFLDTANLKPTVQEPKSRGQFNRIKKQKHAKTEQRKFTLEGYSYNELEENIAE